MRIFSSVAAAAFAVSSASAADLTTLRPSIDAEPATSRSIDWSGPEFGVMGGIDRTYAQGTKFLDTERFPGDHAGAFAGYQYQFSNDIVLGVEGDLSYTWNKRDDFTYYFGGAPIGDERIQTDWSGSIRARVGYAFGDALIFATGGWVATRAVDNIDTLGITRETFNGFTVGAGIDYALSNNVFVRAEYRYNNFGEKTFTSDSTTVDLYQHIVNVGLGMKF